MRYETLNELISRVMSKRSWNQGGDCGFLEFTLVLLGLFTLDWDSVFPSQIGLPWSLRTCGGCGINIPFDFTLFSDDAKGTSLLNSKEMIQVLPNGNQNMLYNWCFYSSTSESAGGGRIGRWTFGWLAGQYLL